MTRETDTDGGGSAEVRAILDDYLRRLEAGEDVDFEGLLSDRPDVAPALREARDRWFSVDALFAISNRCADVGSRATLSPGAVVGDFRLDRLIGRGGMGQVWQAEQLSLARPVALKLAHPGVLSDSARELLGREARAAGRLRHPGIVTVHDAGEVDGVAFIAQELVSGERTLADVLRAARELDELPPDYFERTARFIASVARAVGAAHDEGVVHRDLKPQNVLVTPTGEPKVTDFGLARIEDELSLSRTGDVAGTYHYMSPEQALGRRSEIDQRTDVFSLGVMLYECLTLERPFDGDTPHQIVEKTTRHEPPYPTTIRSRVPWELAVICRRALEKRREERFQSMGELADELARWLAHEPIRSRPPGLLRRARKWVARHPTASAVLFVGFLALGLFAEVLWSNAVLDGRVREVLRLSAQADLDRLVGEAPRLWPAHPANIEPFRQWLAEAQRLVGDLSTHEGTRARLRARGRVTGVGDAETWSFDDVEDRWWHAELTRHIAQLRELLDRHTGLMEGGFVPGHGWSVGRRLDAALELQAREASAAWRDAWEEAIASIASAECPYGGLAIRPRSGILPIGRDRASGLWEFACVQSGEVPERDADGDLVPTESTAIVLVLLPGGTFTQGAQGGDPSGPNYDPRALSNEGPPRVRTVGAFFLSKYEMTQGQWERLTGENPSRWAPDGHDSGFRPGVTYTDLGITLSSPVDGVSWEPAVEVVGRLGLGLPTETEWEYGCRAGTTTPVFWEPGRDPGEYVNMADRTLARLFDEASVTEDWDDGFAATAPVGSYAPNAFGLHDTLGNVAEWSSGAGHTHGEGIDPAFRTGPDGPAAVVRGGACNGVAATVRSAWRGVWQVAGVRPTLGIE